MEGDALTDPALEHIVENLDLGHGHNGGGPDPEAAPRKGWQGSFAIRSPRQPNPVAASLRSPCASAAGWERPAASPLTSQRDQVSRGRPDWDCPDAETQLGAAAQSTRT
jgi:hypothetical protein